jgi:prepilin-type processing-associated H-X9-DG protein
VLIAILLPAVQAAREASQRMACSNNLRQIGIAIHAHVDVNQLLPQGTDSTFTTTATPINRTGRRYSAFVFMLPYMEQSALYDSIQTTMATTASWNNTTNRGIVIKGFFCPSDGFADNPGTGSCKRGNYAVSAGDYALVSRNDTNEENGFYSRGTFQPQKAISLDDITDGTSNTVLASERSSSQGSIPPRPIIAGIVYSVSGVFPNNNYNSCETSGFDPKKCFDYKDSSGKYPNSANMVTESDSIYGVVSKSASRWIDGGTPFTWVNTILPPNSPSCISNNDDGAPALIPPTSNHTNGCQVGFGDGSVQFIANSIDWGDPNAICVRSGTSPFGVWGAIGSRNGDESKRP